MPAPSPDCGVAAQAAYARGYEDGARWGYNLGYGDAKYRRPYILPSFMPPNQPAHTLPPPPAGPVPPSAAPTAVYPTISAGPSESPRFTTVSYFVPYPEGYRPFGGRP